MKNFISNKKIRITFLSCLIVVALVVIGVIAMKMVARNSSIGVEAAKKFALLDAGIKEKNVNKIDVDFTYKDSTYVYDVEFDTNKREYSYFVKASNGIILEKKVVKKKKPLKDKKNKKSKKKKKNTKKSKTKKGSNGEKSNKIKSDETTKKLKSSNDDEQEEAFIGIDEAKSIAVSDSGENINTIVFTVATLTRENGMDVYVLQFYSGNKEYNYTVDAIDGSIRSGYSNSYDDETN